MSFWWKEEYNWMYKHWSGSSTWSANSPAIGKWWDINQINPSSVNPKSDYMLHTNPPSFPNGFSIPKSFCSLTARGGAYLYFCRVCTFNSRSVKAREKGSIQNCLALGIHIGLLLPCCLLRSKPTHLTRDKKGLMWTVGKCYLDMCRISALDSRGVKTREKGSVQHREAWGIKKWSLLLGCLRGIQIGNLEKNRVGILPSGTLILLCWSSTSDDRCLSLSLIGPTSHLQSKPFLPLQESGNFKGANLVDIKVLQMQIENLGWKCKISTKLTQCKYSLGRCW